MITCSQIRAMDAQLDAGRPADAQSESHQALVRRLTCVILDHLTPSRRADILAALLLRAEQTAAPDHPSHAACHRYNVRLAAFAARVFAGEIHP